ncbi:phage terminase large subunit family protein [Pseudomonas chlororaphis subsp. piscium]|nr:phage terminase large subunit family protein [Pseudomonas chlororaphis subsp. piscium]
MIAVGASVIFAALMMDVTVSAGMDRVNNLGLMADRQNYTFIGGVLLIAGLLMAMLGRRHRPASVDVTGSGTRPCPFCAETIKLAAIKCKHCGADIDAVKAPRLKNGWVASVPCRDSEEQDRVRDAISALDLPTVPMIGLAIGAGPFETKDEAKQALAVLRNEPRLFSEVVYRDSVSGKYPPITD